MIVATLVALTIVSVGFVLLPLVRRSPGIALLAADPEQELLVEQRESAYEAMSELDFDRELGKLDEQDYRTLYERYRRQAVSALKATREREATLSSRIEAQVQTARLAAQARPLEPAPRTTEGTRARAFFERSVERRPAAWLSSLAALVLLLAVGTWWVWNEGATRAAQAAPVGRIASGTDFSALLLDAKQGAWALSGDATGLRRSPDGGETWASVPVLAGTVTALTQSADGLYQYAIVANELHRSVDGGQSWSKNGTPPRGSRLTTLAADPADPAVLYALDQAGAMFRSSDRAETWTREDFGPAGPTTSLTIAQSSPLEVFASTGDAGVLSGANGKWASANGVINGALPTDVVHSVAYDPFSGATSTMPGGDTTQGTLYAATDQGVFRSTDYGQDWFRLGPDADIRTVAVGPRGTELLLAVSAAGEVYRSTDRGITWTNE